MSNPRSTSTTSTMSTTSPPSYDVKPQEAVAAPNIPWRLQRLYQDAHTTAEVARTLSLSFSSDPLVNWVRRNADPPWGALSDAVQKWQMDRVRQTMLEGLVVRLSDADTAIKSYKSDYGAIAMLWPPRSRTLQSYTQYLAARWLDIIRYIWPVKDPGADEKRLQTMLQTHHRNLEALKRRFAPREVWYLEVVAVAPELQGRGLGRKLLEAICAEYVRDDIVVLESTTVGSRRLYEGCGFEVLEEVVLEDDENGEKVVTWLMARGV